MRTMIIDVETGGLPVPAGFGVFHPPWHISAYRGARVVQLAWQVIDAHGTITSEQQHLVSPPKGARFSPKSIAIHGITPAHARREGRPILAVLRDLMVALREVDLLVGHNIAFDRHVVASELMLACKHLGEKAFRQFWRIPTFCTMRSTTQLVGLVTRAGIPKWPKLAELYAFLFDGLEFPNAHEALGDVRATSRCFRQLCHSGSVHVLCPG